MMARKPETVDCAREDASWVRATRSASFDVAAGGASSRPTPRRLIVAVSLTWASLVLCVALARELRSSSDDRLLFHGVRLGLTAHDVRDRFGLPGVWRAESEELVWTPTDGRSVREVHFEFHLGSLVAVRARVSADDEDAHGEELQSTRTSLLARSRRSDGDVDLFLVARNCPTHSAEVARLAGRR